MCRIMCVQFYNIVLMYGILVICVMEIRLNLYNAALPNI